MDEDLAQLINASASYAELEANGRPENPLKFPSPSVGQARRVTAVVHSPTTFEEAEVPNVVYEARRDGSAPHRAYWIGRKLKKAIYGCVRSCTVLKLMPGSVWTGPDSGSAGMGVKWEVTAEMAAVKIMDWNRVRALRGKHFEDPANELSAMQMLSGGGDTPNVLRVLDVLQDAQYLYSFMPFCSSGELFSYVEHGRFTEPVARFWFRQLLNGIHHLQKMGISHRDISLENVLVDQLSRAFIMDFGMCLRVPFGSESGEVVDVSHDTLRRLIVPQGQCGKPYYISPEVSQNVEPFDGFAVDVWACGVILFIMLVGRPPFELANREDPRFRMITRGGLMNMLNQWRLPISEDAGDLLQRMLREDPRDRLSLTEVGDHPWVTNDETTTPQAPPPSDDWRR